MSNVTVKSITFNAEKLRQLETGYTYAIDNGLSEFVFDGHLLLTSYARYLIQYLRQRLEVED